MGILQQNQGGKILRQNQGGKILKSNFNFGSAFISNGLYYVQIPAMVGVSANAYSFETVLRRLTTYNNSTSYGYGATYEITDDGVNTLQMVNGQFESQNYLSLASTLNGGSLLRVTFAVISNPIGRIYDMHNRTTARLNDIVQNTSAQLNNRLNTFTNPVFQRVHIGLGNGNPAGGAFTFNRIATSTTYGLFRYYNRSISTNEINFSYNNLLGNEPLLRVGLLIEYTFNGAEILDFSAAQDGSDLRVGVRNFGSLVNGHGEIIGLPAGTLEEKRDFANANLFVTF